MFKLSILLLLLSIPFLSGKPYLGLPLWAWASLGATLLYAIVLILLIERRWKRQKGDELG